MSAHEAGRSLPELDGAAAYPRKNGEPVFEAPWQSRVFGIVVTLCEQRRFEWEEFKERLISHIAARSTEGEQRGSEATLYYECWTAAFYSLATEKGFLDAREVERRENEFRTGVRLEVF